MLFWLVLCAACVLVYWLISTLGTVPSWRTIRIFNKLPGPTDQPFFIGASWDLMKLKVDEVIPYMGDKLNQFEGICAVYSMGQPWLWVSDPDVIAVILKDKRNIHKGPEYRLIQMFLNDGLVTSTGDKWRQRRKLLTPWYHSEAIQTSQHCINRYLKNVVNKLLDSKEDSQPSMNVRFGAFNMINEIALGTIQDENYDAGNYMESNKRIVHVTLKRGTNNWLKNDFIFNLLPISKTYMNDIRNIYNITENIIKQKKEEFVKVKLLEESQYSNGDGKKPQSFLDFLVKLFPEERLEDTEIVGEVHTFMFAGFHTTCVACEYLMMCLAENPNVQEKAYAEQAEIFGCSNRDVTHEDLSKMHYLDQVIKETLRLYPPLPLIARLLVNDVKLPNGQVIPAGTKVSMNLFLTHRNPKHWVDPEVFNPERFSREESNRRHRFSYTPFSAGPRNCIGLKIAMMELKIMGSILLRSCKLSAEPRSEAPKYQMVITLESSTPTRIKVSPRTP